MTLPPRKWRDISRNHTNQTARGGCAICWRSELRRHWQDASRCHISKESVLLLDVSNCWSRTARQRTRHSFCLRMRRPDASKLSRQIFTEACHRSNGNYTKGYLKVRTLVVNWPRESGITKTGGGAIAGARRPSDASSSKRAHKLQ